MNVTSLAVLAIAGGAGVIALLVFRTDPRLSFLVWCVTLFFVPIWVGASVGAFVPALAAVTGAVVLANLHRVRPVMADALVLGFGAITVVLFAADAVTLSSMFTAVMEYVLPYVWGRLVLARVGADRLTGWLAGFATVAAAAALLEFASGTNPFVLIPGNGGAYDAWSTLQPRGGFIRAEGAFGHSIALGASLAMASAFVHLARWRTSTKVIALLIIGAGVVVTFSRIGLVTFVLTTVASVLLLRAMSWRWRAVVLGVGLLATLVVAPFISDVLVDAGDEAAGSASYRTDLLALVPHADWLGAAQGWQSLVVDGVYLGRFTDSIDNTVILMLLRYGIVPTAVLVVGVLGLVVQALRPGRTNPATIAVVAQIPSLVTVALITQYGMFLWFLAGVGVSWWHHATRAVAPSTLLASTGPAPDHRVTSPAGRERAEGRGLGVGPIGQRG